MMYLINPRLMGRFVKGCSGIFERDVQFNIVKVYGVPVIPTMLVADIYLVPQISWREQVFEKTDSKKMGE